MQSDLCKNGIVSCFIKHAMHTRGFMLAQHVMPLLEMYVHVMHSVFV